MDDANTPVFHVEAVADGEATSFAVREGEGDPRTYRLAGVEQADYLAFYEAVAADFRTRVPHRHPNPPAPAPGAARWEPLLTTPHDPRAQAGFGDPAVLRTEAGHVLVATSNSAPDAFPILRSRDLKTWEPLGFVFPEGQTPAWTLAGKDKADFWAPEMARVGDDYWLAYTARGLDGVLAIGLAKARDPAGPWVDGGRPLLRGRQVSLPSISDEPITVGVIDSHLFVDGAGSPILFWKEDTNGLWPRPLATLLRERPDLIPRLFGSEADRRTAAFAAAVVAHANTRRPIERFFLMQPLIGAVLDGWPRVSRALRELPEAASVAAALHTPVFAQRLSADGSALVGERVEVLANDQDWEGHLIEGPWVTKQEGRYWLFYAGNDFAAPRYGIGVAVADSPWGPYVKQPGPLLGSTSEWWAPGHASVAPGVDGAPRLFFHAFHPGTGGYGAFRALLTVGLRFGVERVEVF